MTSHLGTGIIYGWCHLVQVVVSMHQIVDCGKIVYWACKSLQLLWVYSSLDQEWTAFELVPDAECVRLSNHSNVDKLRLVSLLLAVNSRRVALLHQCLNPVKTLTASAKNGRMLLPARARAKIQYIPNHYPNISQMLSTFYFIHLFFDHFLWQQLVIFWQNFHFRSFCPV